MIPSPTSISLLYEYINTRDDIRIHSLDSFQKINELNESLVMHETISPPADILSLTYSLMDDTFIEAYHVKTEEQFAHISHISFTGNESFPHLLQLFTTHFETSTRTSLRNVLSYLPNVQAPNRPSVHKLERLIHLFQYVLKTSTTNITADFFDLLLFRCREQIHLLSKPSITEIRTRLKKSIPLLKVPLPTTIEQKCEAFPMYLQIWDFFITSPFKEDASFFTHFMYNEMECLCTELYFIDYFNEEDDFIYKPKDSLLKITREENLSECIDIFRNYFGLSNYYSIQMILFFFLHNRDFIGEIDEDMAHFSPNKIEILYKKLSLCKILMDKACFKKKKYNQFILFMMKKIDDKLEYMELSKINEDVDPN